MIQANELRIGNWVSHNDNWCYRGEGVGEFQWEDRDWFAVGECTMFLENICPVPITEESLLKLGFEKTDDFGDQIYYAPKNYGKRHYYICFDHDCISFGLSVFNNCTNLIYDDDCLQYVHQLQNLCYDLGEELQQVI